MFLDWKNQYCENDYTTQSNLQIGCKPLTFLTTFHFPPPDHSKVMCSNLKSKPFTKELILTSLNAQHFWAQAEASSHSLHLK